MKKERVRINLDVSKDLADKIKELADENDMTVNAFIRVALESYLKSCTD